MEFRQVIKRTHRIAALVGYSVFGALVLYLVLVELIRRTMAPFYGLYPVSSIQAITKIRYLGYGLSAISVILARVLQSWLLRRKAGSKAQDLLNRLHRTSLIVLIMSELPALFGLIMFLIHGLYRDFYILLVVSIIVLFIFFPRRRAWEDWILSQTKTEGSR